MTDHLRSGSPFLSFELSGLETDGERLGRIKRALRETDRHSALVLTGSFEGNVSDAKAQADLIRLLVDTALPVLALPSGTIGPRGLLLLLAADRIILERETNISGNWRESPGVAAMLHQRLGPLRARALLFDPSADPLAILLDSGVAARLPDPSAHMAEMAASLAGDLGKRLKRALKASSEMPFDEALAFGLWFARRQQGSTS